MPDKNQGYYVQERLIALRILFSVAFAEIALAVTLSSFSILLPRLFSFLNALLLCIALSYIIIPVLLSSLINIYFKIVFNCIITNITGDHSQEVSAALEMLKDKTRTVASAHILVIFGLVVYFGTVIWIKSVNISLTGIALALGIIIIPLADLIILAFRISKGRFADNETEIRELLTWILSQSSGRGGSLNRMRRITPLSKRPAASSVSSLGADKEVGDHATNG